jgi:hypothetical protein
LWALRSRALIKSVNLGFALSLVVRLRELVLREERRE